MIHHIKSKPITTEDGRDNLIGMVMKTFHVPNVPRSSNLTRKDEHKKQMNDQNVSTPEFKSTKCSEKTNCNVDAVVRKKVKPAVHDVKTLTKDANLPTKKKNNFVCKFCCHPFRSLELLEEHRVTHGSKPDYVCHVCNHQGATFSALMSHYLRHSGNKDGKFKKIQPKNKLEISNKLNISSHSKPKFECPQCKEYFINKDKFNIHVSVCKKKVEYNCAYCGHMSSSVEEYRNHVQSHTVSPFSCRHCKFKAQTKKQLDKHYETCKEHPKPKENITVKCGACKIMCKSKKEIADHMKICSELKNKDEQHKNYKHSKTKKNFKQVKTKKLILKIPTKNKNSVKITEFGDKKEKLNEIKNDTTDQCETLKEDTMLSEEKCNFLESSPKTDSRVENSLESISDIQSSIDSTRRSARLVGRRCSFLEDDFDVKRSFKMKAKLLNKVKKQKMLNKCKGKRGRKPKVKDVDSNDFYCSDCNFSFCSKSTLLRHQRMHSGDPWYTCKFCGKFFFRKDVYIRHEMNVHTKIVENVFCCYYCKMYFNLSSLLKEHVLAEHKQSAFMPLKLRRPSKNKNQLKKTQVKIKQEPLSDDIKIESDTDLNPTKNKMEVGLKSEKKSTKVSLLVQNINREFKCGVCLKLFANNDDIESHMIIHNDSETPGMFHKKLEVSISSYSEDNSYPILKKEVETPSKNNSELNMQENVSCEETFDCMSPPELMKQNIENENADVENYSFDIKESSLMNASEETSEFLCILCLQKFSSQELLTQHNSIKHRIIDWYQCVVCSFCGPQQDVIEHMLMHMYKVGTFVISGDNFDPLLPHLTEKLQQNESPEGSSDVSKIPEETGSLSAESSISPNLPPLKEFGYITVTSQEKIHDGELSPPILTSSQSTDKLNSISQYSLKDKENVCIALEKESIKSTLEVTCSNNYDESIDDSPKRPIKDIENNTEENNEKIHAKNLMQDVNFELLPSPNFSASLRQISEELPNPFEKDNVSNKKEFTGNKLGTNEVSMPSSSIERTFCNSKQHHEKIVFLSRNDSEISIPAEKGPGQSSHETSTEAIDNSCSSPKKSGIYDRNTFALNKKPKTVKSVNESIVLNRKNFGKEDATFSQLRYLLENFRSDDKSREKQDLKPQTESPSKHSPLKKMLLNKSFENFLHSPTKEQKHLSSSTSDSSLCVDMRINNFGTLPTLAIEEPQNTSRCLKFDINQSRGEFSETSNCAGIQKQTDSFKPNPTHAILDFSNLLENTTSNENIFECHASTYPNLNTDFSQSKVSEHDVHQSSSSTKRHEVIDGPLDFSRENSQCVLDYSKHNSQTVHPFAELKLSKNSAKNNFLSKKTGTKIANVDNIEKNRQFQNFSADVSSNKITQLPIEIEEVDEMDMSDGIYDNLPASAKCSRCHEDFNDISELMRHTPNCLQPIFCEKQSSNTLQPTDTLRSLLEKSNTNFSDKITFANYYNSPYATVNNLANENIKNLSKNS